MGGVLAAEAGATTIASADSEVMADNGLNSRLIRIGIGDTFCDVVGDQSYLRDIYGMS